MKSKLVDTLTSNEDDVRFRIFAGELPLNEAYQELLRLERSQRKSDQYINDLRIKNLCDIINKLQNANSY